MNIENESSFVEALKKGINLFLGAGFSVLAMDVEGIPLPTGGQLTTELHDFFSVAAPNLDLPKIAAIISHTRKEEFTDYLTRRYTVGAFDPAYFALHRLLKISAIFTTNIDDLLYRIFDAHPSCYLNDLDSRGPAYGDRSAIDLIALHGSVIVPGRGYRFGPRELSAAFRSDPDRWHFLTGRLQRAPTLFWGYSLADAGTLEALSEESTRGRKQQDKWVVVHPSEDEASIEYYRAMDFQIVRSDTAEMLDYLTRVPLDFKKSPLISAPTSTVFPQESIPAVGTVPGCKDFTKMLARTESVVTMCLSGTVSVLL